MSASRRIAPALLALSLSAQTGPALAFTPERAAIFVDALRANDCAMTGEEAPVALPPLGLNPDEVQQFVDILFTAELVGLSEDLQVLTLSDTLCSANADQSHALIAAAFEETQIALDPWTPEFSAEQGAAMIGAVRGNDCALSDAQAGAILPGVGIDPDTSRSVVAVMLEAGLARVDETGAQLLLSEELCNADPALDAETVDAARIAFVAGRTDTPEPEPDALAPAEEEGE